MADNADYIELLLIIGLGWRSYFSEEYGLTGAAAESAYASWLAANGGLF